MLIKICKISKEILRISTIEVKVRDKLLEKQEQKTLFMIQIYLKISKRRRNKIRTLATWI